MKIEGYVEISKKEFGKLPDNEKGYFNDYETKQPSFFKKAQKFPIVFEGGGKKITIDEYNLKVYDKTDNIESIFGYTMSFPLLVKAVEKAKEVMKKE